MLPAMSLAPCREDAMHKPDGTLSTRALWIAAVAAVATIALACEGLVAFASRAG